ERFSHIQHIVSTVTGHLGEGVEAYDALWATFPAGTLSGAPKPSAMRIIDRLEPVRRGVYGGTVGYVDFAGDMDMAIAIRTAVIKGGTAHVQAGGGVGADSDATMEHREPQSKAAGARPAARRPRPGRRTTVLAGTAASALLAGTTRLTWIDAAAPDLTGTLQQVDVPGAEAAPAVLALALVAIAASLATSLPSAWLRFVTGPVLVLTGGGAALAALGVVRDPS